jgi:hypothetical protein
VASSIFGALIVYTIADTLIPGFALKLPPPEFETPHAPGLEKRRTEEKEAEARPEIF